MYAAVAVLADLRSNPIALDVVQAHAQLQGTTRYLLSEI